MGIEIALTVIGVAVIIVALLVLFCHYLGMWTWVMNWMLSSNEEKVQLTKSGHFNANGYMVGSDSEYTLNATGNYHRYDNLETDFRFMDEAGKNDIPPQPVRPAPVAPVQQQHSVESISEKVVSVPEPCVDLEYFSPNLKRAMSCDSVSSDTSVMLESLEDPEPIGQLQVGLEYDTTHNHYPKTLRNYGSNNG